MVSTSINVLREKSLAGEVEGYIIDKIAQLCLEIGNKNAAGANAIQMVNY